MQLLLCSLMWCWKLQLEDVMQKHGEPYLPNVKIMAYVDDDVIMGGRLQDEVFTTLVKQTNKMGLEINGKKIKILIVS